MEYVTLNNKLEWLRSRSLIRMRDIITGQMSSWFSSQAGNRPLKRRDIKSTSLLLMVLLALIVTA